MRTGSDTIAAISTPPGENGIGIVRLSGPAALEIAGKIFRAKDGRAPSALDSHSIYYGYIVDKSKRLDEVLLTVMRAPKTYTREDIVEINCHGGIVVIKQVLDLVIYYGARIAEPGEFTKRAFLNGRIDLMQAEAVLDIITSRTGDSLKVAQRQLSGEASGLIKDVRRRIIEIMAEAEAEINFPEESLDTSSVVSMRESLSSLKEQLSSIIKSSDKGAVLRNGITTVICGKPNVGKSTLMNSFLRQDKVIVTPVPGTTRDAIEDIVDVKGIPLKIVDTAGIMHAEDEITKESIERSRRYMDKADLILLVLDSSDALSAHDFDIIDIVKDKKTLVVVNKTDLPERLQVDEIKSHLKDRAIVRLSAKNRHGMEELEEAIHRMFWQGDLSAENILISNARHIEALRKTIALIGDSAKALEEEMPYEAMLVDLRDAAETLGKITGETLTDEVLETIFSKFCIGK